MIIKGANRCISACCLPQLFVCAVASGQPLVLVCLINLLYLLLRFGSGKTDARIVL